MLSCMFEKLYLPFNYLSFLLFNCTLKKAAACSRKVSNDSMSRFGVGSEKILTMIPIYYIYLP